MRRGSRSRGGGRGSHASRPPQMDAKVTVSFFHCVACLLPLKPPVFKCEAGGHVVCCRCHGGGRCMVCDRATSYRRCAELDAMVGAVEVPCRYAAFGCERQMYHYHEAGDHDRECASAPCFCPEPGCGAAFSASPAALLDHLAAVHSWPVAEVRYGKPCKLAVPPPRRCRYLLAEKDDRSVFLVTLFESGPATAVSLVCVRGNAAAAAPPRFRSKVWVEVASNKESLAVLLPMVGSSDLSGWFPAAEQPMCLTVPLGFADEEAGEDLLSVRIEKL